ncbi:MAG: ribosomal L7Ae/L30e/S12e/Gadd45 family protein [Oscillospiraceae bacterium]|nr:ribosomal L7Ae/L30e/S12e/Gadd45 family protein [Oscillospiraceae bacterium]MBQ4545260.1 ribosomal L7Ae/L30e/S12e/Gadd45 family protein [Oscillospiraceae bacterium]MBQ6902039.1 ribosomal L7Ae/L30e/S12e/Gadd45 family protein [Oscillospiraceae bacterium]
MLCEFASSKPVVGIKQSKRAVSDGLASSAFVARDADPDIIDPFSQLCEKNGVRVVYVDTMEELGRACGINVGAAVAVLLK